MSQYYLIDQPSLLKFLFYPRKEFSPCPNSAFDLFVPVEEEIYISTRFYIGDRGNPWILFFHGNGEVLSDYDTISRFFTERNLNLVVVDYRGYGASGGEPTFSHMINDAHTLFKAVKEELVQEGLKEEIFVMGRSLGSVSALELAYYYPEIKGLIIESGFLSVLRIINHLGIATEKEVDFTPLEEECLRKARSIDLPSLIIHGEYDTLVPLKEAKDLYENLGTGQKEQVIIPHAEHNNIIFVGGETYFGTLKNFVLSLSSSGEK